MRLNLLTSVFIGLTVIMSGCEEVKDPVACFTTATSSVSVNSPVSFTNCSENAESYEWNFGDGNSSTGSSASHVYTIPGTYTVTLTAFGEETDAQTSSQITVTGNNPNVPACEQQNIGWVKVRNNYDSNYSVYINGIYKGTVSGYGTSASFEYPAGSNVSVRILQNDGYVFYPSEFFGNGLIVRCQTITVTPA
jgi:PKD repeat protein